MLLRLCLSVWTLLLSLSDGIDGVLSFTLGSLELSNFGFIVSLVSSSSNQPGVAGMMFLFLM